MSETPAPSPPAPTRRRPLRFWLTTLGVALLLVFIVVGLVLAARPPADQVQGMVEAETFTVATKAPSRVEQLLASEGQQVAAGEVLAVLSSPEIEAKDAQARATERAQSEAQRLAQEMGLPPGMKLPV